MKIQRLLLELQDCMDPEAEVVILSQPDRPLPLYYHVRRVEIEDGGDGAFVVLEEGSQIGYHLPKAKP